MGNAWDRQPGESAAAYAAFCAYYVLPPGERSIDAAYRAIKARQKRDGKRAPGNWAKWSVRFNWVKRALAYDEYRAEQDRIAYEQERRQDKQERIRLLKAYRRRLETALAALDPQAAEWRDVTAGLKVVIDELRSEYDDNPTQRVELSGAALNAAIERELARLAHGGEAGAAGAPAGDEPGPLGGAGGGDPDLPA